MGEGRILGGPKGRGQELGEYLGDKMGEREGSGQGGTNVDGFGGQEWSW